MKVLTINIHSHFPDQTEKDYSENIKAFSEFIYDNNIDLFAIQECGQTHQAKGIAGEQLGSFVPGDPQIVIKEDNCAWLIANALEQLGMHYYWTWSNVKIGYGKYDEGIALFSKKPIEEVEEFYITTSKDIHNWKVRKITGIKIRFQEKSVWAYSVHMGWWNDEEEKYEFQLNQLKERIYKKKKEMVLLMGDLNNRSDIRGEGYDAIIEQGWIDTFELAEKKDSGITVLGNIDGWKEGKIDAMRIDYILSNKRCLVQSSKTAFNGMNGPIISDHYGVIAELE